MERENEFDQQHELESRTSLSIHLSIISSISNQFGLQSENWFSHTATLSAISSNSTSVKKWRI
jgi:hypothetical protein